MTTITSVLLLLQMAVSLLTGVASNPSATAEMKGYANQVAILAIQSANQFLSSQPTPAPTPTPIEFINNLKPEYLSKQMDEELGRTNRECSDLIGNSEPTLIDMKGKYDEFFDYVNLPTPKIQKIYFMSACEKYLNLAEEYKLMKVKDLVLMENKFNKELPIYIAFLLWKWENYLL